MSGKEAAMIGHIHHARILARQDPPLRGMEAEDILSMIEYLKSLISVPDQAGGVLAGIQRYRVLTSAEQQEHLATTYLALEQYLVELDPNKKFLREQLREIIKTRYSDLVCQNPRFNLIFHPAGQQEVLLCRELLMNAVRAGIQKVPASKRYPFMKVLQWLEVVPQHVGVPVPFGLRDELPSNQAEWLAFLRRFSIELYRSLTETIGEGSASQIYESCYEELVEIYALLETFPVIMYLLPEGLMDREKLALLRVGNIRRILSGKSEQLHEITEQLLTKNNELAAIRTELNKAKNELEQRVLERTLELETMNRQLRAEIAERRTAEAALTASQEYARNIIESSLDMIVAVNKNREIVEFNRAAQETFGYARDEVMGKHVKMLYADPASNEILTKTLQEKEGGAVLEVFNKRKSGELFPSILSASVLCDAQGMVIGYMGVSRDVTRQKEAEETLRRSEERYRTLFEESKDAVFICSNTGQLTDINAAGLELFGFQSKNELLGASTKETLFFEPEHSDAFFATLRAEKFVKDHEMVLKRNDGQKITVSITANAVTDAAAGVVGIRGIMRDVTERKQLEQQLLQSQKLESIGMLAGGIAHDINNVLTPILIAVDTFKTEVQSVQGRELLDMVEASAKRGADIVKQILTIARRVEGERMEIDLRHLVKEIMRMAIETFPKTIRVRTGIPKELWRVVGDASQLHQILLNLTVNARDAMPEGGILTMSLENMHVDEQYAKMRIDAVPGPYVIMTVADTGTGITRENLGKIFEPFFTTKGQGKGTGLGLSTVHSIAKNHRGFVEVTSEVGKGTSFRVFLPAIEGESNQPAAGESVKIPRGQGECILVVDDEPSIRDITVLTLEKHGYRAFAASEGTQAVAFYSQRKPEFDLVITDMSMPVMDGPATIQALERIDPGVRVIAVSGHSSSEETESSPSPRVLSVLQKPYTAEKLLKAVHEVLASGGRPV